MIIFFSFFMNIDHSVFRQLKRKSNHFRDSNNSQTETADGSGM